MVPTPPEYPADFERALLEHFDVLYRMARSLAGSEDGAEDLVQEASLRAMRAFPRLEHHDNLRSWFARIVHTTFLDQRRYEQRRPTTPLDDLADDLHAHSVETIDWEPSVLREGFEDELESHLDMLPPSGRAVLQLVDVEGFSYEEAADALDIPVGTVRSRLFRSRRYLYQALGPHPASDTPKPSTEEQP